jgi:crotonobetainyl-CoA:carnitine CoA-transferase CaiB-like acyl-CoA transferase
MTLDMRNKASIEVLQRLAPTIDVVVENAKPGVMEARGFGYPQCKAINPGITWCAITGFGQSGPYAQHAGHDLSYLAHSGLLGALSAQVPWQPALPLALQAGAFSAVVAIQASLIQRGVNGEGSFVDVSLSEAATWLLTCGINPLSDHPLLLPTTPDRRLYRCADGRFVAVACAEPRTWEALCDGLDLPELKPNLHQAGAADATSDALEKAFIKRPAAEWVEQLAPLNAAVTVFNHANQLLDDPQVIARGSVVEAAGVAVPASPVRLTAADGSQTATTTDAPRDVGDDTAAILKAIGYTDTELAAMASDGVI